MSSLHESSESFVIPCHFAPFASAACLGVRKTLAAFASYSYRAGILNAVSRDECDVCILLDI